MKSVMISIKPQYCELITSGKKTIEVRKTRPKIDVPFKVYIYCTIGGGDLYSVNGRVQKPNEIKIDLTKDTVIEQINGTVIGEFICDKIFEIDYGIEEGVYFDGEYQNGFDTNGSGDNIACLSFVDLENYLTNNEGYGWHISDLKIYDKPKEVGLFRVDGECSTMWAFNRNLERPPQSWCYVEELK